MTADVSGVQDDVRRQVAGVFREAGASIVADAAAIFPLVGVEPLDAQCSSRIGNLLLRLLSRAVRDGRVDARSDLVEQLRRLSYTRSIPLERLFAFAYLLERSALDELALHRTLGATTEPWPLAAQLVRRASFDLLAAIAECVRLQPTAAALMDPVTTLFSRPLFDTVLAKELDRAGRVGQSVSLMLFDVDRLSVLNEELGPGVGDKLLERMGVVIRGFFRQQDWVARYTDDSFAVLLTGTDARHAKELAGRVRATVAQRLEFTDHRTHQPVRVTVTAAVVTRDVVPGEFIDPERLVAEAEAMISSLAPRSLP